jgi:biotin transporter BioY
MGWLIGYFLAIWLLGFIPAAPVTTFLYLRTSGREKWWLSLVLALVSWLFFYGLSDYAVHLPFPSGLLLDWLHI